MQIRGVTPRRSLPSSVVSIESANAIEAEPLRHGPEDRQTDTYAVLCANYPCPATVLFGSISGRIGIRYEPSIVEATRREAWMLAFSGYCVRACDDDGVALPGNLHEFWFARGGT